MNATPHAGPAAPAGSFAELRQQFAKLQPQLALALPAHVTAERFVRVVLTAIQQNQSLLKADRDSLFGACMKAAQDGLMPDGREAFLNCYFSKKDNRHIASYQPMIGGVLKKIRQSGELKQLSCMVVREGDEFSHFLDETGEHFRHVSADDNEAARVRYVYAAAWTKDGGFYFRKMPPAQIEKVRAVSRAKDEGPWVQWWEEMAMKTVLRNLAKRLPMSAETEQVIRRVDDLAEIGNDASGPGDFLPAELSPPARGTDALKSRLLSRQVKEKVAESLAVAGALPPDPPPPTDAETGEILPEPERFTQAAAAVALDACTDDAALTALVSAIDDASKRWPDLWEPAAKKAFGTALRARRKELRERADPVPEPAGDPF